MIDKIEVTKRSKTRRAKLYYLRKKTARKIREKLRRIFAIGISTVSEVEQEKKKIEQEKQEKLKQEKEEKLKEEKAKKEEQEKKKIEQEKLKQEQEKEQEQKQPEENEAEKDK